MRKFITLLIVAAVLLLAASCSGGNPIDPVRETDLGPTAQSWLITIRDGVNPNIMANQLIAEGKSVDFIYTHAIKGLAIRMSEQAATGQNPNPRDLPRQPEQPQNPINKISQSVTGQAAKPPTLTAIRS